MKKSKLFKKINTAIDEFMLDEPFSVNYVNSKCENALLKK